MVENSCNVWAYVTVWTQYGKTLGVLFGLLDFDFGYVPQLPFSLSLVGCHCFFYFTYTGKGVIGHSGLQRALCGPTRMCQASCWGWSNFMLEGRFKIERKMEQLDVCYQVRTKVSSPMIDCIDLFTWSLMWQWVPSSHLFCVFRKLWFAICCTAPSGTYIISPTVPVLETYTEWLFSHMNSGDCPWRTRSHLGK